jgi:ubiquinone/menaquinone biosynthesis C-methylase UbiE
MDATHLAFADRVFEQILCVESAFHFQTRAQFFAEAYRVLKPGGAVVLWDMLFRRLPRHWQRYIPRRTVSRLSKHTGRYSGRWASRRWRSSR